MKSLWACFPLSVPSASCPLVCYGLQDIPVAQGGVNCILLQLWTFCWGIIFSILTTFKSVWGGGTTWKANKWTGNLVFSSLNSTVEGRWQVCFCPDTRHRAERGGNSQWFHREGLACFNMHMHMHTLYHARLSGTGHQNSLKWNRNLFTGVNSRLRQQKHEFRKRKCTAQRTTKTYTCLKRIEILYNNCNYFNVIFLKCILQWTGTSDIHM